MRSSERNESWFDDQSELIGHLRDCHQNDEPMPSVPGYEDLAFLERGGQGTVYLAHRVKDGRREALKVFHPETFTSSLSRRRFEREIQLVSRLKHPGIVRLFRWGQARDQRPFLAMEYVDGMALDEFLETASVEDVIETFLEICDALQHAHRRGVIHRDLKPGNVRVDSNGHARLLDFGLAKEVDEQAESSSDVSFIGQFVGTLAWASPEQIRCGADEVDTRSDIYSLGVMLYQALTDHPPYPTDGGVAELTRHIVDSLPRPPSRWNKTIDRDTDTVVLRCLAKDPNRRYQSVADLARDLERVLDGEPIEARRDGLSFLAWSIVRKHPLPTTLASIALLALVALAVVSTVLRRKARDSEVRTQIALEQKRSEADRFSIVNEFLLGNLLGPPPAGIDPHEHRLEEAVDRAAPRIEQDPTLLDRPRVRADLHVAMAYWYGNLHERLQSAEDHARTALELYRKAPTPEFMGLAWAQELVGNIAFKRGDLRAAGEAFRQSVSNYKFAKADELNLARVQSRLISTAFALGEFDDVRPYAEDYLQIVERLFGAEDAATIKAREVLQLLD